MVFFYNNKSLTYLNEKYITNVIAKCSPANSTLLVDYKPFINGSSYSYIAEDFKMMIFFRDQFGNNIKADNETIINGKLKAGDNEWKCRLDTYSAYKLLDCFSPEYTTFIFELIIQSGNNSAYFCCTVDIKYF